jgi:hypothetical protein
MHNRNQLHPVLTTAGTSPLLKAMSINRKSSSGLLDYITVTQIKTERPEYRFRLKPGYFFIQIYPLNAAGLKVGRSKGFDMGDVYTFLIDPATGWAKWWFTPANVSDD